MAKTQQDIATFKEEVNERFNHTLQAFHDTVVEIDDRSKDTKRGLASQNKRISTLEKQFL